MLIIYDNGLVGPHGITTLDSYYYPWSYPTFDHYNEILTKWPGYPDSFGKVTYEPNSIVLNNTIQDGGSYIIQGVKYGGNSIGTTSCIPLAGYTRLRVEYNIFMRHWGYQENKWDNARSYAMTSLALSSDYYATGGPINTANGRQSSFFIYDAPGTEYYTLGEVAKQMDLTFSTNACLFPIFSMTRSTPTGSAPGALGGEYFVRVKRMILYP